MNSFKKHLENERRLRRKTMEGKIGWALLWVMGVPLPILAILYLLRGCD